MTYVTKNDRKHFTAAYATADAAAINWLQLRINTCTRFQREHHRGELLGDFIVRTGAPF